MLDLIGIEASNRLAVLRMIAELRRGRHLPHRGVHAWRAPSATITTAGGSPVVANSEDLGSGPVTLRAVSAALRLVRP